MGDFPLAASLNVELICVNKNNILIDVRDNLSGTSSNSSCYTICDNQQLIFLYLLVSATSDRQHKFVHINAECLRNNISTKLLIQPQSELDIGSWYVTHPTLPTHPTYLPTQNSPCCCCSSWIIKAISLVEETFFI